MKVNIFIVVCMIALSIALAQELNAVEEKKGLMVVCGAKACANPSDLCCSNNLVNGVTYQCYSAATHDCLPDLYVTGKNSLCPTGHFAGCKGVCFDTDAYYCDSTGKVQRLDTLIKTTSPLNDQTVIKTINVAQDDWTAGPNPIFSGKTVADLRVLVSTKIPIPLATSSVPSVSMEIDTVAEVTNAESIMACTACSKGDLCCAGTCYNPGTHQCLRGFLCPVGHFRCGASCYKQSQYSCYPGNVLCPLNSLPCGNLCYKSSLNDCCNNVIKAKGSCPGVIPTGFTSASKWPNCINPIGNQGNCGSCWAFSAAQILGDRYCINKNLGSVLSLSSQYQVSCDTGNLGCSGGWLDKTWSFLAATGIPTAACVPYAGVNGVCPAKCANNSPIVRYKSKNALKLNGNNLSAIQTEIMTYGPIHAAFTVYNDFFYYTSGVYTHITGALAGGHAVRVLGWGVESYTGKKYWIVANSWGTGWGMNGYFWISRGNNECGFESNMWRALPV